RVGRAGINASAAASAVIGGRKIDFKFKVADYFGQKIKRTVLFRKQIRVFSNPADARFPRPASFEDRSRVSEHAAVEITDLFLKLSDHFTQYFFDHFV